MLKVGCIYRTNNEIARDNIVYLNSILKINAMPSNSIYDVITYRNVVRASNTDRSSIALNN
jgi:hypothetical protein